MGTRGAWANDFLHALGNANPSEDTQKLVAAWTLAENTDAKYNPLATTYKTETATVFNSANVRNYPSRDEGIRASVATLDGDFTGYAALKRALLTNDPTRALASGGFDTWGSKTVAVTAHYLSGDHRGEPLKSEEGGSVSGSDWTLPQEPRAERSLPENERQSSQTGTVTEEDIRGIAKQFLGLVFIAMGGLVFVIAIIKTDTAQAALKTAVKVAV